MSCAATECISLLIQDQSLFKIDHYTFITVIDRICYSISEHISFDEKATSRESSITALFDCLTDWLVAAPRDIIGNPNIALRVSEIIEETLHEVLSPTPEAHDAIAGN